MSADGWLWVDDLQHGDGQSVLAATTPERATVLVTDPDHRPGTWTLAIQQLPNTRSKYCICWMSASSLPTAVCTFYRAATLALIETITEAAEVRAMKRGPVAEVWPGTRQETAPRAPTADTEGGEPDDCR
jgi:hypothetical protein